MMYEELVSWLREEHKPNLISDFGKAQIESAAKAIEDLNKKLQDSENDNINITGWLAEEHAKVIDGNAFIDAIIKSYEREKWIPMTERLPQEVGTYLVFVANVFQKSMAKTTTAFWEGQNFIVGDFVTVTHWMPLPEPPKEET